MISKATTANQKPLSPEVMSKQSHARHLLLLLYMIGAALVLVLLWFVIARPVQVLPRMRTLPSFTLVDQNGRWFGLDDLHGRVVLLSVGALHCGDQCQATDARMQQMHQQLRADGYSATQIQLLTVSVDPADTPAALQQYAIRLQANQEDWHLLTGIAAEVKQLIGGELGIYYTLPAGSRPEIDQRIVLIDGAGVVRAIYDPQQLDPATLNRDIGLVLKEAQESLGSQRVVYEAAHLFVCYPQ